MVVSANTSRKGWEGLSTLTITAMVLVFGVLGAFLGHRSGLPAGVLTGTMIGVGVALGFLGFPRVSVPSSANGTLQVLVGILVGLRVTRESLDSGARSLLPAALLALVFLLSGFAAALAAVSATGMNLDTALFAAAPGGLTEMASIGVSLGADGIAVAAIHVLRLLMVIFAINLLIVWLQRKNPHTASKAKTGSEPASEAEHREGWTRLGVISVAGLAGGVAGLMTPLPAGGVIGALIAAGLARIFTSGPVPTRHFQLLVQVLGGGIIGLGFSAQFFATLAQLAGAAAIVNFVQMLVWLAAGLLLVKVFRIDLRTATFAAAPGGMGTLLSIAGDTDADLVAVTFTHLLRLSSTVVIVPLLVGLFLAPG